MEWTTLWIGAVETVEDSTEPEVTPLIAFQFPIGTTQKAPSPPPPPPVDIDVTSPPPAVVQWSNAGPVDKELVVKEIAKDQVESKEHTYSSSSYSSSSYSSSSPTALSTSSFDADAPIKQYEGFQLSQITSHHTSAVDSLPAPAVVSTFPAPKKEKEAAEENAEITTPSPTPSSDEPEPPKFTVETTVTLSGFTVDEFKSTAGASTHPATVKPPQLVGFKLLVTNVRPCRSRLYRGQALSRANTRT